MLKVWATLVEDGSTGVPAAPTMLSAKPNLRTPPTEAVIDARRRAAVVRVLLAALGALLSLVDPAMHPHPVLAASGFAVIAATGALQVTIPSDRSLRIEEPAACLAGVLLITLGPDRITGLTLLWLCSVATGVIARGGRATAIGRFVIVAVLLSPTIRFGPTSAAISLLAAGIGLLLVVGRITVETSELMRDSLTGVISRAALTGQLGRLVISSDSRHPTSLIMIDLDDFGAVNKQQGHAAGDHLLIRAAETISTTLRPDDVLGRLGGDEFVVVAPGGQPGLLARRIVEALGGAGISASAGTAQSPRDAVEPRALLAAADFAMRRSKRGGKGRVTDFDGPRPETDLRQVPRPRQPLHRAVLSRRSSTRP